MAKFFNRQWRLPNNENKDKQSNYSMDFDGSSQQINSTSNLGISGASPRTFSAWMKTTDAGGGFDVIVATGNSGNTGNNFELDFRNNVIMWERWGLGIMGSVVVNDGSWHHACITYDGNILKLYVDGSEDTGGDFPYTIGATTSTDAQVRIGGMNHSLKYFNGQIDAVSIFDYALSQSQITTLYGSSSTGIGNPMSLSPKPVAYYPLGDQDVYNGADYLVPNSSLKDYVFNFKRITSSSNGRININNALSFTNKISVSIWFNYPTTASTNTQYIIAQDNGSSDRRWILGFNTSNKLWAGIYNTDNSVNYAIGTTTVKDSKWHQAVLVYDGTSNSNGIKIFLDGKLEAQSTASATGLHTGSTLMTSIGNASIASQSLPLFDCDLSNAQLWDTDLTYGTVTSVGDVAGGEIETLYNYGSPYTGTQPQAANLQGWWKLDASATYDGSNWTIEDHAGSNDGTSSGMSQSALQQSDLQYTSGYSPYALQLDGTSNFIDCGNISALNNLSQITISFWYKFQGTDTQNGIISQSPSFELQDFSGSMYFHIDGTSKTISVSTTTFNYKDGNWHNFVCTYKADDAQVMYIDNTQYATSSTTNTNLPTTTANLNIGRRNNGFRYADASLSNASIWKAALTSSQVTEIYSEGIPQNLLNHSAVSSLVSWWQLGSNSSFNNTVWTVLDEKGTNDGVSSTNMSEVDIVNGVGYSSNGVSSGMSDNVVGDSPYSTANSLSVNMDVLDRTTDIPN
tara:strand:+ start:3820 stop:6039 length:2220 start_codon:yes stop_codon:yes gene_type:complete